eukprot:COSAG02_NODE_19651_length_871_cov_1.099741_2_plen_88_part_00
MEVTSVVHRRRFGMEASSSRKRAAEGEVDGAPLAQKHQIAAAADATASESVVFPSGDFSSCMHSYWAISARRAHWRALNVLLGLRWA